jgi:SAM-dependent methyltransferase
VGSVRRPADLAIDQTISFLFRFLSPPARVLDVGCGRGDLAARLLAAGFEVTALDHAPDAVEGARAAGVSAIESDFLRFHDAPYDAVIFSRSLHHLRPLRDAVVRAAALMKANAWLIAEEFARERADRTTAAWFYDVRSLLQATGWLTMAEEHDRPADALSRWRADHYGEADHPRHDGVAMLAELRRHFDIVETEDVPYLYWYCIKWIDESPRGYEVARRLFEIETRRIAEGLLVPLGLRIAAKRISANA